MNPMASMGRPPAMGGMPPSLGAAPMSQAPTPQMGGTAPSTGNVMQITSTLRGMSDQQLQQYAAMHKSDPFVFPLAFQESQTRQQMRAGQAAQMAGQKPPPVVDQDLAQMSPPAPPSQALPEDQGIGAIPAQNLQNMADGGIAGYADGGPSQPGMFNYAQMAPAVDLHPNSGVTPRSMAGGGLAFKKGGASVYQPITDEEINAITGSYKPSSAEELAAQRATVVGPMNAEMETAYKPYAERLAKRESDLAGRKESNINNALLAAGLGMMAGTSPHAFANIGKGGIEGLQTYTAAQKADQAAQDALDHSNMLLMQAQRAERSGNSRDATMLLDAAQKAKETHIAHGLTGLQLKNTSQYNVGQLANTELQRDIEAGKAAEIVRHNKQIEDLYYGPMGAAAGAKKANALTPEEIQRNKVDAIINGMPAVKNLAARLKDPMIDINSTQYIEAQKELYKITAGKYKEHGLEAPSYADYVSQEVAPKPKKPGFNLRQYVPESLGGLPSKAIPTPPGVKFLGFEQQG